MIEMMRKLQPTRVACISIEINEHFVHATEFSIEHLLSLASSSFADNRFGPRGKFCFNFQRGLVAGVSIGIAQIRQKFYAACTRATTFRSDQRS